MREPDDDELWEDDEPDEDDVFERAMQECGIVVEEDGQETCLLAATEYCDFECPFRNGFYERLRTADAERL